MTTVTLVLAADRGGTIGRDGAVPWHLPDDLRHFKATTTGGTVVMGRRTWDEIRRPLPGRRNVVLTRQRGFDAPGAIVAHDLDAALAAAGDAEEVFVIGGADVYRAALPRADRVHLTLVDAEVVGDTRVPRFWEDESTWELVERRPQPADERHAHPFEIRRYERRR